MTLYNSNQYDLLDLIGSGTFGKVYTCKSTNSLIFACKRFKNQSLRDSDYNAIKEIACLSLLNKVDSLYIPRVYSIQTRIQKDDFISYIYMEYFRYI